MKWTACAAALSLALACTPRFNREKHRLAPAAGLSQPILDMTAQGGSAAPGITPHFRVSRVAIGGNVRRIQAITPSGIGVQAGPGAPH